MKNDFVLKDQRARFSRQHHARFRGQNSTHTLVSLFDNAVGDYPAKASAFESWGLLLALRTDVTPMTVELVARYSKPFVNVDVSSPREKARGETEDVTRTGRKLFADLRHHFRQRTVPTQWQRFRRLDHRLPDIRIYCRW